MNRLLASSLLTIVLLGCGRGEGGSGEVPAASLPPEVKAQLAALEEATNQRIYDQIAAVYDDRAQVQSVALLGYGSKAQFIESLRGGPPARISFGATEVVSAKPERIRAITEVTRQQGESKSTEKVFFEWVRIGGAWLIKEQSFPDWSPLVGEWCRGEGDERVTLRMHPSGNCEMVMTSTKVPVRRGAFSSGAESFTLLPDAEGAGATGEGRLDYGFTFEFDGGLNVSLVGGVEKDGLPGIEGTWRRCAFK